MDFANFFLEQKNNIPQILICSQCKSRFPIFDVNELSQSNGSIEIKIKCTCSDMQIMTIENYFSILSSIKYTNKCTKYHTDIEKEASEYCKDCKEYLCKECLNTHNKSMVNHLNSLSMIKVDNLCTIHSQWENSLFCRTCHEAICSACVDSGHKTHVLLNIDYFNKKFQLRKLYENFSKNKKIFIKINDLYQKVSKYIFNRSYIIPYLHDINENKHSTVTNDYFTSIAVKFIDINNVLIRFIESLFYTNQMEKNNIIALYNLIKFTYFNNMLIEEDFDINFNINERNLKEILRLLIAQFHFQIVSLDINDSIADYYHIKTLVVKEKIRSCHFIQDDSLIAILSINNIISIFISRDFEMIRELKGFDIISNNKDKFTEIIEMKNGLLLLPTEKGEIYIFNLSQNVLVCSFPVSNNRICHILEYSQNKVCFCTKDNCIKMFDLEKGIILSSIQGQFGISSVIQINESLIAAGGYVDDWITLWDTRNGGCAYKINTNCSSTYLLFKASESYFISSSSNKICKAWDCKSLECIKTLDCFESDIQCICFVEGKRIAFSESNTFQVWLFDIDNIECQLKIKGREQQPVLSLKYLKTKEFASVNEQNNTIDFWLFEP